ncbi:MAG: DNA polymerase III subunit gamma/tau, partial [Candidatus Omnitrophica bacterium]|nr:DNA polymerase III subunit gamma/tau [Candidatus Omnitrophota bacterium]
HAYLFSGPRGIGKTSTARIFAKALNCLKGPTDKPCNQCANCGSISAGNNLDVLEIDGASNRGIDEIRNLRENVKLMPAQSKYKVYIIDEVHMLTNEAFNALLKTLEEPPPHVKFIFATTAPYKISATILSRCQRFDFKRLTAAELVAKLKEISKEEKVRIKEDALFTIARAAEGGLRDAETILEQLISFSPGEITNSEVIRLLGMVEEDILNRAAECIQNKNGAAGLMLIEELLKDGKDLNQFVISLVEHLRNLLVLKVGRNTDGLIELPEENIKYLTEQSRNFSAEELLEAVRLLLNTADALRRSSSPRVLLEMVVVRLTNKESAVPVKEKETAAGVSQLVSVKQPVAKEMGRSVDKKVEYPSVKMDSGTGKKMPVTATIEEKPPEYKMQLGVIKERWDEMLVKVLEEKVSTGTCLAEGSPVDLIGGSLTIGFSPSRLINRECLERVEDKELIERIFTEQLGEDVRIKFITTGILDLNNDCAVEQEEKEGSSAGCAAKKEESACGRGESACGKSGGKEVETHNKREKENVEVPIIKKAIELFDGKITEIKEGKKAPERR